MGSITRGPWWLALHCCSHTETWSLAPAPLAVLSFASYSPPLCNTDSAFFGVMHSGLVFNTLPSTEMGWGLARKPWRQVSMDCCCSGCRAHTWPQTFTREPTHVRFSSAEEQQWVLGGRKPSSCSGTHCSHALLQ